MFTFYRGCTFSFLFEFQGCYTFSNSIGILNDVGRFSLFFFSLTFRDRLISSINFDRKKEQRATIFSKEVKSFAISSIIRFAMQLIGT